ncbi:SDR family oxidoreductase [Ilumatobacter nonamiensis]|uniref:SDR family oxidoreductase n=1 Tax=Ilumatobacter nonamiensis TaxID=467093 RepID=UPI00034B92BC|nr:SDR family oxidoreductase [Ilumatobacter nonamiensis]
MTERVLVTGATGYIGGRLVPHLLDDGADVVCLVRHQSSLVRRWSDDVTIARGSADEVDDVAAAAADCRVAYYLIHSLGGDDFQDRDRKLAEAFRQGCERAGVERIVYLGGLGDEDDDLSPHLLSRQETGRTLAAGSVPVTELRAAIIIGSGSASFEMLRSLTEVLPVMVTPSWVNETRCQPTAIRDVLQALLRARHRQQNGHDVLELGGPNVVTYREMMNVYARAARLPRRRIIGVPILSPWLSSHWVSLVTPLPSVLATQLVGSLVNDVVVTKNSAVEALDLTPITFTEAVAISLSKIDDLDVPTSWSGAAGRSEDGTPEPDDPDWAGGVVLEDTRTVSTTDATPRDVFDVITRLGGHTGWMWGNWLWGIRGVLDSLWGGAGLRRGRRHPSELALGDAVDFWRVDALDPDVHLRLRAEMKLPGYAWLEWTLHDDEPDTGSTTMVQRARYIPRGLFGRAYWYVLTPFHAVLFPRLARRIVAQAESAGRDPSGPGG